MRETVREVLLMKHATAATNEVEDQDDLSRSALSDSSELDCNEPNFDFVFDKKKAKIPN